MLIEKSQELISLSQRKIDLYQYAQNSNGFQERHRQINQAVVELSLLIETLRIFRQKGMIAFDFSPKITPLLEIVSNIKDKFQENPEWIIDNKNFNGKKFQSDLDNLTNLLKQQLLQSWRNYLARRLRSTKSEFFDLLSRIDAFRATIQKIRNLDRLIKRDEFPKNKEEFDNTEQIIYQLEELWNNLNTSEVPDVVLCFLKASVSQEGAPLNLLTSEVRDWITKHGVSEVLRIRLL
jgi:GGDEF domain-containing protein